MAQHSFLTGIGRNVLNLDPEGAFFGKVAQTGNRRVQDYFRGQFGDVYDRFVGSQGLDFLSGRNEPQNRFFFDYLEDFDFLREFQGLSPSDRGEFPSRFAPRVRFNA